MICKNCQNEIEDGVQFCPECGAQIDEAVENAPEAQEYVPEETVPAEAQEVVPEQVEQTAPEVVPEVVPEKKSGKIGKKVAAGGAAVGVIIAIVAAVVVIAAVIAGFVIFSGPKTIDLADYPVFYANDDEEIKYVLSGKKEGYVLSSDEEMGDVKITADGKYVFFGTEYDGGDFDLCYRKLSAKDESKNKTIVKGISSFKISPDGKTVFYKKNNDIYKTDRDGKKTVKMGKDAIGEYIIFNDYKSIQYYNDDGEAIISNGVDKLHKVFNKAKDSKRIDDLYFTENEKEFVFFEMDREDYEYTIYTCGTGKNDKAEKVDSKVTWKHYFAEEGILYYAKDEDLFYMEGNKKPVAVEGYDNDFSNICYTYDEDDNRHFYLISEDEKKGEYEGYTEYEYNLYYLDGKKAKLMVENYGDDYYSGAKVVDVGEYDDEDDEYKYTYYFRKDYDEFVEIDIPEEDNEPVDFYSYPDAFYTLENYDEDDDTYELIKYKYTSKGVDLNSGKLIAEDVKGVSEPSTFFDNETFAIQYDEEEYAIYNGKKLVEINEDVHDFLWAHKDGTMILAVDYNKEDRTYSLAKFDGKNTTVFAEDVKHEAILGENLVYFINEDDELMLNKGKLGKDTKIDDDVEEVMSAAAVLVLDPDKEYEVDFRPDPFDFYSSYEY